MSGPAIRPAISGDVPSLAAILNAIIRAGGSTAMEDALSHEAFAEAFLAGPDVLLCHVALDGEGVPCGFQGLTRHPALPPRWADIATFTRRVATVRGAGAALFAETRQRARAAGVETINATVRADNRLGLAYYRKLGFEPWHVDRAVPLKSGTRVDRIAHRLAP